MPVLDKFGKKSLLEKARTELCLSFTDALSVGDGANDVPMLATCNEGGGLGVAYRAKPKVRTVVSPQINHGDLTALLYTQGYRKDSFK